MAENNEFKLDSGAVLLVTMAPFEDTKDLHDCVIKAFLKAGIKEPNLNDMDMAPFILTAGSDKEVERCLFKCAERAVYRHDGSEASLLQILVDALDWLEKKLADSKSGLIEYHAHNDEGIKNQVWKDSKEFYVHENGRYVNHSRPVASIEVQGLAYDALMVSAELFGQRSQELKNKARKLRDRTIELLWLPHRNYFGLGVDYDQEGDLRIIETQTANPASLLNCGFFNDLAKDVKEKYDECKKYRL